MTTQVHVGGTSAVRELRLLRSYATPTYRGGRLIVPDCVDERVFAWQAGRATSVRVANKSLFFLLLLFFFFGLRRTY